MPVCKLITYQNPLYAKDGAGKFFDEDSYMDIWSATIFVESENAPKV